MELSLSCNDLADYVAGQCNAFFPDEHVLFGKEFSRGVRLALERAEYCFSHIRLRGYGEGRQARFHHLHSDQYAQFLYYLANSIWQLEPEKESLCRKLILLNRALHGCWFSYKGRLPDIFLFDHPVGTVLGNASYSDYAYFSQNVTINTQPSAAVSATPLIGKFLFMSAGAKIIGEEPIGNDVTLGVDAVVYHRRIPDGTILFKDEETGRQVMKEHAESPARRFFWVDDDL